jgi:hypothetical protein
MSVAAPGREATEEASYLIAGRRLSPCSAGFDDALELAHESRQRPRCLCVEGGVEMYTARLDIGRILKRMPGTGNQHAAWCGSYEPPAAMSGFGELLGSAIKIDHVRGGSVLRLGFPLSRRHREAAGSVRAQTPSTDDAPAKRLSLLAVLHYLWHQAELTRWRPSFAGKRSWATVRKRLLDAASDMRVGARPLTSLLCIPEPFRADDWPAIQERRREAFMRASCQGSKLFLVLAELKDVDRVRGRHRLILKHLPDITLLMSDELQDRVHRRFENEFELWATDPSTRLLLLTTVGLDQGGRPVLSQMALATFQSQWLPVKDDFDHRLVARLIREERSFIKLPGHAKPAAEQRAPVVLLTDTGIEATPLFIGTDGQRKGCAAATGRTWEWHSPLDGMPALPDRLHPPSHPSM